MKLRSCILGGVIFLTAATAALADPPCQKCTHDLQVKYRACLESKKDQAICGKEQQAAAQACVAICQKNKAPDEKS